MKIFDVGVRLRRNGDVYIVFTLILFLCLMGGHSRGQPDFTILSCVLSVLLLVWCVWRGKWSEVSREHCAFLILLIAFLAYSALYLLPVPFSEWRSLGARADLANDMRLIAVEPDTISISVNPERTQSAILRFFPALSVYISMVLLRQESRIFILFSTCIIVAAVSFALGLMQIASHQSQFYFYLQSYANFGEFTGTFSNVNHQAMLLLINLPVLLLIQTNTLFDRRSIDWRARIALAIGLGFFAIFGIVLAGSMTVLVLLGPVLIFGFMVWFSREVLSVKRSASVMLCVGVIFVIVLGLLLSFPGVRSTVWSILSSDPRWDLFSRTSQAIGDYFPVGSGLGTFESVYPNYEDASEVTPTFVNHAHNEYLQLLLEVGVVSVAVGIVFGLMFALRLLRALRGKAFEANRPVEVAALIIGLYLAFSFVDYPLRTQTHSIIFLLSISVFFAKSRSRDLAQQEYPAT